MGEDWEYSNTDEEEVFGVIGVMMADGGGGGGDGSPEHQTAVDNQLASLQATTGQHCGCPLLLRLLDHGCS